MFSPNKYPTLRINQNGNRPQTHVPFSRHNSTLTWPNSKRNAKLWLCMLAAVHRSMPIALGSTFMSRIQQINPKVYVRIACGWCSVATSRQESVKFHEFERLKKVQFNFSILARVTGKPTTQTPYRAVLFSFFCRCQKTPTESRDSIVYQSPRKKRYGYYSPRLLNLNWAIYIFFPTFVLKVNESHVQSGLSPHGGKWFI